MKKLITAALLLLTAIAAPASAAETPFYAGVQAGDGMTILGGYQIDKMFAAQLEYTSYSSRSGYTGCGIVNCGNHASANSLGLFGVAVFPLNLKGVSGLSVFGKAGLAHTTVNVWGYTFTDNSVMLGGGAQYDFNPQISARLGLDLNGYYSDNLYIGALLRF